jgi:hypothetical protein
MGYKSIDEYLIDGDGVVLENEEFIEDFIWSIEIYGTTFMNNKLWSYISKVHSIGGGWLYVLF